MLWGTLDKSIITGHENGDLTGWDLRVSMNKSIYIYTFHLVFNIYPTHEIRQFCLFAAYRIPYQTSINVWMAPLLLSHCISLGSCYVMLGDERDVAQMKCPFFFLAVPHVCKIWHLLIWLYWMNVRLSTFHPLKILWCSYRRTFLQCMKGSVIILMLEVCSVIILPIMRLRFKFQLLPWIEGF